MDQRPTVKQIGVYLLRTGGAVALFWNEPPANDLPCGNVGPRATWREAVEDAITHGALPDEIEQKPPSPDPGADDSLDYLPGLDVRDPVIELRKLRDATAAKHRARVGPRPNFRGSDIERAALASVRPSLSAIYCDPENVWRLAREIGIPSKMGASDEPETAETIAAHEETEARWIALLYAAHSTGCVELLFRIVQLEYPVHFATPWPQRDREP